MLEETSRINLKDENYRKNIETAMKNVKEISPLIYCITNYVTINDCANAALAIGGSPIMSNENEEAGEITNMSNSLVINIGTLHKSQIESIFTSAKEANETNTPIIFDPVGAGISNIRNKVSKDLIENYKITAIRGNMSEIKAIANLINLKVSDNNKNNEKNEFETTSGKGVDVNENDIISPDNLKINGKLIKELAKKLNTVISASGPIDIISDGEKTVAIKNGDELMPLITGSGCMLTTLIGTYSSVNTPLIGTVTASLHMTIAGENAAEEVKRNNLGTGSFRTILIDNLYKLNAEEIIKKANIYTLNV